MSETSGRGLSITALVVALLALVVVIVTLVFPRPAPPPTSNNTTPPTNNTTPTTPPASTLQLAKGEGLNVTDVQPSNAEPVVLPFDIMVTTDKPAAGGISEGRCKARNGQPDYIFSALLAGPEQMVKQLTNHFSVSKDTLAAGSELASCDLTISLFGISGSHVEQHVTYTFSQ